MRPARVFNGVDKVPMQWNLFGMHIGVVPMSLVLGIGIITAVLVNTLPAVIGLIFLILSAIGLVIYVWFTQRYVSPELRFGEVTSWKRVIHRSRNRVTRNF